MKRPLLIFTFCCTLYGSLLSMEKEESHKKLTMQEQLKREMERQADEHVSCTYETIIDLIAHEANLNVEIRDPNIAINALQTPLKHLFWNVFLPHKETQFTYGLLALMIKNGAHLNRDDQSEQGSLLNCLCRHWRPELNPYIELLLQCGANPQTYFINCSSALEETEHHENPDAKKALSALFEQYSKEKY